MIERKYEKQIVWLLRFTEEQDGYFREILRFAGRNGVWPEEHGNLLNQLLACFPKEEKEDEKTDDLGNIDFDEFNFANLGPIATIPVGPPASRADARSFGAASAGIPGDKVSEHTSATATETRLKASSQSNWASIRTNRLDAASTDANLSRAKKLGLFNNGQQDYVATFGPEFPHRQPWTPDD